jgi:preprotein translocase subunit SecD
MRVSFVILLFSVLIISCSNPEPVNIETLEFRIAETEQADSLEKFTMSQTGEDFYLHQKGDLSARHIAAARISDWNNSEAIEITFNDEGRALFAELTRNNIGKQMGIVLNGELVSAPVIRAEITNGRALVPLIKKDE